MRILDRQAGRVGIGEEHQLLAGGLERGQEGDDVGAPLDLGQDLLLEGSDVQPERLAPVIHAVPVEGAADGVIMGIYLRLRLGERQAESLGIARRHQGLPQVVVKMEIDQGAVHVEQNGIYLVPGQGSRHGVSRCLWGWGKRGAL